MFHILAVLCAKSNYMARFAFRPIPPRPEGRGFSGFPGEFSDALECYDGRFGNAPPESESTRQLWAYLPAAVQHVRQIGRADAKLFGYGSQARALDAFFQHVDEVPNGVCHGHSPVVRLFSGAVNKKSECQQKKR